MKAHRFIDVSDDSTLQGPKCHHRTMFGGRQHGGSGVFGFHPHAGTM